MKNKEGKRSGQAMLIAVLSLGGAMLGATAIAGILILYQVRASTDSVNSAKAIFAADTGINWSLFSFFCGIDSPSRCPGGAPQEPTLPDGATMAVTCYDINNNAIPCTSTSTQYAVSIGSSLNARRAFYLNFLVSTSSFP